MCSNFRAVPGEEVGDGHCSGRGHEHGSLEAQNAAGNVRIPDVHDEAADPPALVCQVGGTQLRHQWRCVDDLHTMLKQPGDWVPLGGADEQKPAPEGSVEAWGRSPDNPVGGWCVAAGG